MRLERDPSWRDDSNFTSDVERSLFAIVVVPEPTKGENKNKTLQKDPYCLSFYSIYLINFTTITV